MAVSKRLRYEILRRDNHTCRYCGGAAPDVVLTVDHVTPTALGGSDAPENLVAACKDCNSGKTSVSPDAPLVADVAEKAVQWGAAIERWTAQQRDRRYERDCYVDFFADAWAEWTYGPQNKREQIPKPADWKPTIWQFFETSLPFAELEDAVTIACGNERVKVDSTWRYMCGVAWRKVEQMHAGARSLVEQEDAPVLEVEDTEEYHAGAQWVYDKMRFSDLAHELLAGHIDGRKVFLADSMRWVA